MSTKPNKAKHSPGPWLTNGLQVTAKGDWKLPVCVVLCKSSPRPTADAAASTFAEAQANVRLLAAAPDLLEELQAITDEFAKAMFHAGVAGDPESLHVVLNARAAIAKAMGEKSP
jgi:hypothetical protein